MPKLIVMTKAGQSIDCPAFLVVIAVAKVIKISIVGVGLAIDVRNVPITDRIATAKGIRTCC